MHNNILTDEQRKLLPLIKAFSKDYYLVGGTAIGLYIAPNSKGGVLQRSRPINDNKVSLPPFINACQQRTRFAKKKSLNTP